MLKENFVQPEGRDKIRTFKPYISTQSSRLAAE